MTTINDEILRVTGGPTVNDGLASFYSKTDTENLQDAEKRFLLGQLVKEAALSDMWFDYLGALGHTGSLADRLLQFWESK